ncbi:hypothetical protein BMS3Abin17_01235 [archaeon BMS3Abin17]|nr:hypothetical protein BMS3Abin17_01235 [archaeon BMS3Abin17]HDZ60436.1 hypothetical protein [Candidatus Pacearchaeota archaeon]
MKNEFGFKQAWAWPERVEKFFKKEIKNKKSCHVFCGSSPLGDIRIDIEDNGHLTHKADILQGLPFKDESFEVVFGDPPWHIAKHLRSKIMYEMRRICKVNGMIILNANWNPNNLRGCFLLEPIYISGGRMPFGNSAMIIRYLKIQSEKDRIIDLKNKEINDG